MVTPSVDASTSPILSNTASRSPATVNPVLADAEAAGVIEERLTDCVASAGSFIAPDVSGRFRSGGTSSGRFSGLCAYRSLPLRNQLQPEAPRTATASAAAARKRIGWTEGRIWISCGSGRECIAAGVAVDVNGLRPTAAPVGQLASPPLANPPSIRATSS